jgi:hypothetical protein
MGPIPRWNSLEKLNEYSQLLGFTKEKAFPADNLA